MRRFSAFALVCLILVVVLVAGCSDDESQPKFTRVLLNPASGCGVLPLDVDGYAITTGGNETGSPTGGNANLEITWDFGDGGTGSTSIAYHTYTEAAEYTIRVTAKDPDGQTATASVPFTVLADTLLISASTDLVDGQATTGDIVQFDIRAQACSIDPDIDDDYRNLLYHWTIDGPVSHEFFGRSPRFTASLAGDYTAICAVSYQALAVTRLDTLYFTAVDAVGP